MTSARVEHMLDEIARLSGEEQAELVRDLPRVLRHRGEGHRSLTLEAVQRAIGTRERIRQRLAAAAQPTGSIDADLDEVRDGRLEELLDGGGTREQPQ
jgi:hypothetical protein